MKTQTPPHRPSRLLAGMLALPVSAALLLSSCHHGVYGQRYPHPHLAIGHRHAPDYYGPARWPGQTAHRKIVPGKKWPYHYHTTWADLHHGPRDYRLRMSW